MKESSIWIPLVQGTNHCLNSIVWWQGMPEKRNHVVNLGGSFGQGGDMMGSEMVSVMSQKGCFSKFVEI